MSECEGAVMSILIIYESKSGYTKECASLLEKELKGKGRAVHVKQAGKENLKGYDHIVIGSAVYAGRVPSSIRRFVARHKSDLMNLPLSLFVCGTGEEYKDQYFEKNYDHDILKHAERKGWFGGKIILSEHRGLKKMMLASILKEKTELHVEKRENIAPFAEAILGK